MLLGRLKSLLASKKAFSGAQLTRRRDIVVSYAKMHLLSICTTAEMQWNRGCSVDAQTFAVAPRTTGSLASIWEH